MKAALTTATPHPVASAAEQRVSVSGDLRRMTVNTLMGVLQGDIKAQDAAIIFKGVKEINVSLYSEIKHMSLLIELGREAPALGGLPLYSPDAAK